MGGNELASRNFYSLETGAQVLIIFMVLGLIYLNLSLFKISKNRKDLIENFSFLMPFQLTTFSVAFIPDNKIAGYLSFLCIFVYWFFVYIYSRGTDIKMIHKFLYFLKPLTKYQVKLLEQDELIDNLVKELKEKKSNVDLFNKLKSNALYEVKDIEKKIKEEKEKLNKL